MYSVNLKKGCAKRIYSSKFESAESFDPEFFKQEPFGRELRVKDSGSNDSRPKGSSRAAVQHTAVSLF